MLPKGWKSGNDKNIDDKKMNPLPDFFVINLFVSNDCRASGLDFLAQSRTSRRVFRSNMRPICAHLGNPKH
jgi:hypothetical protein